MEVQLIDRKHFIFLINGEEYMYIKPKYLMKDFGKLIEAKVKGSTMIWNIEGTQVSYNQIKKVIKNTNQ